MSSFPLLLLWYFRLQGVPLSFRCNINTQVWVLCSFLKLLLHDKIPLDCEWRIWFCMSEFELRLLSLAGFWQCPCTAQTLPLGHVCRAVSSGPGCSGAAGKHPTCIPQAVFPAKVPGQSKGGSSAVSAVQCLQCSSSVWDPLGWFKVKHPICVLMGFLCICNIWNSLMFCNIFVCWTPVSPTDG